VNLNPFGGVARYARSFYELLGNRRKFERAPMTGTILVTFKGSVLETTHVASCTDISARGIGIECPGPLMVEAFVEVHTDEHGPRRRARVRYCLPRDSHHRIGLEFIGEPV
jgi:hypothetical protein